MTNRKLIARQSVPHGDTGGLGTQGVLPETLLSEQVQRVAVATVVGAGLWTYGLLMDAIVRPLTVIAAAQWTSIGIELVAIATSCAMFLYVRYASHAPRRKADAMLFYLVASALGVALLNSWEHPPTIYTLGLSWTTVVILVGSMIVPTTPGKMLVTALIAASMDPLVVWIGHLRGLPTTPAITTAVMFAPNYACAIVAMLPSSVLQRVGRRLQRAQELGSYHLVEPLGRGGMGEVWLARHQMLARSAAIKLVRPELLGAATEVEAQNMLRRFEREAQATAALSSPHTIRLFDFGVTAEHTFYYVMELLDGRDLESLVRDFGPLPADRALALLKQVCHSLADAHARGLVHRDVTPSNIYACRMGLDYDFVKVLDFGLVSSSDPRAIERTLMTGAEVTTGTPAFMAPEAILDHTVDPRADVYALGCVAYYLLTGQFVFEADTPMRMFAQHLQLAPIPPSERTELPIPSDLEAVVLSCLAKDPARRPQSALELLRRLEACRLSDAWSNDDARAWWELHLTEFTGPLPLNPQSRPAVKHDTSRTTVAVRVR
jgi:eukaryotic-like serine/threonine-protein kinase